MNTPRLVTADELRAAAREPALPFSVRLGDRRLLTIRRLLRVLPGKRLVGEAEIDGQRVLAKLFIGKRAQGRCRAESDGLERLRGAAVPSARLLATSAIDGGGWALLLEFLEPAETLAEVWERLASADGGVLAARELLEPALAILGRLHAAGLRHDDLHLGNFLRHAGRTLLLDGDAVRAPYATRPLPAKEALANLAVLLAQLPLAWDDQCEQLLPAYSADHAVQAPDPRLLRQQIARVRKWRLADFLAKTVRDCTLFAVDTSTTRFSTVVRRELPQLADLLADLEQAVDTGEKFKDGGTTTVARVQHAGRTLLVKRYNVKSLRHACGRLWRPSRGWHSWREAHRLRFLGIPTPAPLALIEERFGPLRRRAWLISEFCPGENLLEHWPADRQPPEHEARALLELLAATYRQRISHGDLKATNLLWDGTRVLLIDLDAAAQHGTTFAFRRAWRRDRARLLRNWPADSLLHRWLDARLPPV